MRHFYTQKCDRFTVSTTKSSNARLRVTEYLMTVTVTEVDRGHGVCLPLPVIRLTARLAKGSRFAVAPRFDHG